ncbi:MAG: molybdenum ABC transporter ATP-binding protein [Gammaproteobacteria bacterium]|nr:molybdenum ABC transporter ATP-binding protein [Gammaproteobacteria bacterium]
MSSGTITARFNLPLPGFTLDIDLILPSTGVSVLFGHSGSGKTTLLRCIAGLERASGHLSINGIDWQTNNFFLPTYKRPLGYVFQEASLFTHLSVMNNLKYGMKRSKGKDLEQSLEQSIELLGIKHVLNRKPDKLSGGERQRVAIARSLAVNPKILLMDEPLASLDMPRKQEILPFLERLRDELAIPMIYVTHAADEVARLADHLVIMSAGKAVASGTLTDTLSRLDLPVHLGKEAGVVLQAKIIEIDHQWSLALAEFEGGNLWIKDSGFQLNQAVRLRVLARDVSLSTEPQQQHSSMLNTLPAIVNDIATSEHPALRMAQLKVGNSLLLCRVTARSIVALNINSGSSVWAQIKSAAFIE